MMDKSFKGAKDVNVKMCASGCQMSQWASMKMASKDPLYVGPNNVKKHLKITKRKFGKRDFCK